MAKDKDEKEPKPQPKPERRDVRDLRYGTRDIHPARPQGGYETR